MSNEDTMTPAEAEILNSKLAVISVNDIPKEGLVPLSDYLVTALNMKSVDTSFILALEYLLQSIHEKENLEKSD